MPERMKKNLVNIGLFSVIVAILFLALPRVMVFFMPFVIGWIIALIANPFVRLLEKRLSIRRKHGSMLLILSVLGLVVLGIYCAVVKLWTEAGGFIDSLPQLYQTLTQDFRDIEVNLSNLMAKMPPVIRDGVLEFTENFAAYIGQMVSAVGKPTLSAAGNAAKSIPGILIQVIFTVISAYFFIADRERIFHFLRANLPASLREKWHFILNKFKVAVGGYFKAQFKIMGVVALILLAGFLVLDIPYALLLALLISFLDFLPFFGTGTVLIPWGAFKALSGDYQLAFGLLIIYLVSQLVRQVIQPKIVGDTIGLDPLLTLIFMFIGYRISSLFGMIVAVPIGMIVISFYQAGAFDDLLQSIKEVAEDLNTYRKKE